MLRRLGVHAPPVLGLDIHDPPHGLDRILRWCRLGQALWGFPHKGLCHRQRRLGDGSEVISSLNCPLATTDHKGQERIEKHTSRQTATLPFARVMSMWVI
jgi:hypothetical protein